MNGERNVFGRDAGPEAAGGVDKEMEELLTQACASLRFLSGEEEPLSLREAIARGRRVGKEFEMFQESGAPINDVVVRSSEGGEVALQNKGMDAEPFMYGFSSALSPGAVLHFYRKADQHHGEVLLLAVAASAIGPKGFTYNSKYRNGQVLNLRIRRGEDELFEIMVEWTRARAARRQAGSAGWAGLAEVVGAISFALASLGYYLWGKLRRHETGAVQVGWAIFIAAALLTYPALRMAQVYVSRPPTADAPAASFVPSAVPAEAAAPSPAATASSSPSANRAVWGGAAGPTEMPELLAHYAGRTATNETGARAGATPGTVEAGASCSDRHEHESAEAVTAGTGAGKFRNPESAPTRRRPAQRGALAADRKEAITLVVKTYVKDDTSLQAEMLSAFISASKGIKQLRVLVDGTVSELPEKYYEVNLNFEKLAGCYGVILAKLYDPSSEEIWDDARHCEDYPKRKMLEHTSREFVREIVAALESQHAKPKGG